MKKIIVLGDAGVGKTNLIKKYIGKSFEERYIETQKIAEYKFNNNIIYDYPGQIKFGNYGSNMFKDIDLCVLVYDTTNRLSFKSLQFWKDRINSFGVNPEIIIVGNKTDSNASKINECNLVSVKNNNNLNTIFNKFNN